MHVATVINAYCSVCIVLQDIALWVYSREYLDSFQRLKSGLAGGNSILRCFNSSP